jgi:ribonuclease HII
MRIAGVDEAGRGCVIGPLVVAGVVFAPKGIQNLEQIGVRDSKQLSSKRRERFAEEIVHVALQVEYFELQPRTIDKVVFRCKPLRRLNYLETMVMARVIRRITPDIAYVDPCDVDHGRCAEQIKSVIPYEVKIICEPKADQIYLATGAASILAKVRRDKRINELKNCYGDFGSGYPSDKKTAEYIKKFFLENKECPDFIRESWKTVRRNRDLLKQTELPP